MNKIFQHLKDIAIARLAARNDKFSRPFAYGRRPVIRWFKDETMDDVVTRSAIAQATRVFGKSVDYCLCTYGHDEARVRGLGSWSVQPVEWWPVSPSDNPELADELQKAGCPPEKFGRWWKWFPERVRLRGPEWILDGDMVIVGAPAWFRAWRRGENVLRVTQDEAWNEDELYGDYVDAVDKNLRLYSGLVALPPHLIYRSRMLDILRARPLKAGHDGRYSLNEQGVAAAAFSGLGAVPIPLHEFPQGRAFEANLNHGRGGPKGEPWGYHFQRTFRGKNPHFARLVAEGKIYWQIG